MSDDLQLGRSVSFMVGDVPIEGTVIYRDLDKVRIALANGTAVEFAMNGRDFAEEVGPVTSSTGELPDHYTAILGVKVGDTLEFLDLTGAPVAESGKVAVVITSETPVSLNEMLDLGLEEDIQLYDAVIMEDGRIIDFSFRGPPADTPVIRIVSEPQAELEADDAVVVAKTAEAATVADAKAVAADATAVAAADAAAVEVVPTQATADAVAEAKGVAATELAELYDLMSGYTEVIKEKPTINRTYDDAVQRKEMFDALFDEELRRKVAARLKKGKGTQEQLLAEERQKNDRRLFRRVDREVEIALSLKNKSLDDGVFIEPVETIQEAVDSAPLPAAIPVVVAARTLNIDAVADTEFKESDVAPRILADLENEAVAKQEGYLDDTEGYTEFNYYGYMYDMFENEQVLVGEEGDGWRKDQEVIRTAAFDQPIEGLGAAPNLPGIDKDKKVVLYSLSAGINRAVPGDRIVRVLTGDVRGRNAIAPSDPSIISDYVILPPKVAMLLHPSAKNLALSVNMDDDDEEAPTMAEVLRATYGEPSPDTAWNLSASEMDLATWIGKTIDTVHPADALAPRTPQMLQFLDTFGLGDATPAVPISEVINAKVADSQAIWSKLIADLRVSEPATPRTYTGGLLWTHLRGSAVLADVLREIEKRNPTIYESTAVLASGLMTAAQGDAMPLVWWEVGAMDGREQGEAPTAALELSRKYILRRVMARDKVLVDLAALDVTPEINTCEHVALLENIRDAEDVVEGDVRLLNFINAYREREDEDWVYCKICHKECVCKHDVMRLKILAEPWNAEGIQKRVMKTFGGERYLGKIVCRVCGQPLEDIEYDDNVEFDDSGKAVLTSSVLTAEQLAPLASINIWGEPDPTKMTAKERTVYARTQRADAIAAAAAAAEAVYLERLTATQRSIYDVYRSMTAGVTAPLSLVSNIVRLTEQFIGAYVGVAGKLEALQAANKKTYDATIAKFGAKKYDSLPPRRDAANAAAMGAITALLAIAAQQGAISITSAACTPNLKGYPGEPGGDPAKSGVLKYLSCVIGTNTSQDPDRLLVDYVIPAAFSFSGNSKSTVKLAEDLVASIPPLFTPEVVVAEVEEVIDEEPVAITKHVEQVPATFRPDTAPILVEAPLAETIGQLGKMRGPEVFEGVSDALRVQGMALIGNLHRNIAAVATIAPKSTEGVCCPADMDSWARTKPSQLLKIYAALLPDIPFLVANGSLFKTVVEPPVIQVAEGRIDEEVMAKLFKTYCHVETKPSYGNAHEFSYGNRCRRCGYTDDEPPVADMDVRFRLLSDRVRANRQLEERAGEGARLTWRAGLEQVADVSSPAFGTALKTCLAQPAIPAGLGEKELKRKLIGVWAKMTEHRDTLKKSLFPGADTGVMKMLVDLTADPFVEGPRLIQEYLCASVNAVATKFAIDSIKGAPWAGLARPIDETMTKVLQKNAAWSVGVSATPESLRRMVITLTPAISTWIKVVRPASDLVWTVDQAQKVLLTLILDAWASSGVSTEFMAALLKHARSQSKKYSTEDVKRLLQLRAAEERALILSEFDSIKDEDQRAVARTLKNLGIGRWAIGKNITKLDAGVLLFEEEQRRKMGITDEDGVAPVTMGEEEPVDEEGYDVNQAADGDDE